MISAHISLISSAVFPHSCNCVKPTSQMKFLRQTNSNLSRTYDRNHPFFAVEVSLQRSVTYNVPSQPTFLPLPGRINITVNVYMRTALRATVSLTLPLCSPSVSLSHSLFFLPSHKLQRVPVAVSHFFSSRGEPSRLTFFRVAHTTTAVVYNSQGWSRTRDFYVHTYVRNERRPSLWTTLH